MNILLLDQKRDERERTVNDSGQHTWSHPNPETVRQITLSETVIYLLSHRIGETFIEMRSIFTIISYLNVHMLFLWASDGICSRWQME